MHDVGDLVEPHHAGAAALGHRQRAQHVDVVAHLLGQADGHGEAAPVGRGPVAHVVAAQHRAQGGADLLQRDAEIAGRFAVDPHAEHGLRRVEAGRHVLQPVDGLQAAHQPVGKRPEHVEIVAVEVDLHRGRDPAQTAGRADGHVDAGDAWPAPRAPAGSCPAGCARAARRATIETATVAAFWPLAPAPAMVA